MRIELGQAARAPRRGLRIGPHGVSHTPFGMKGMTLVELLTVIAVLAILSTIAFSSYRRYMVRTNRTDASTSLLRVQVAQEKWFLQKNTYSTAVVTDLGGLATTPRGNYDLTIAAGASGSIATSFVATATAKGPQATDDPQCLTMTIDDRGQQGATPGPVANCWR